MNDLDSALFNITVSHNYDAIDSWNVSVKSEIFKTLEVCVNLVTSTSWYFYIDIVEDNEISLKIFKKLIQTGCNTVYTRKEYNVPIPEFNQLHYITEISYLLLTTGDIKISVGAREQARLDSAGNMLFKPNIYGIKNWRVVDTIQMIHKDTISVNSHLATAFEKVPLLNAFVDNYLPNIGENK